MSSSISNNIFLDKVDCNKLQYNAKLDADHSQYRYAMSSTVGNGGSRGLGRTIVANRLETLKVSAGKVLDTHYIPMNQSPPVQS